MHYFIYLLGKGILTNQKEARQRMATLLIRHRHWSQSALRMDLR